MGTVDIGAIYDQIPARTKRAGSAWYPEANRLMQQWCGPDYDRAAGITAALSPRVSWSKNLEKARTLIATGQVSGIGAHCRAARRIRNGENWRHVIGHWPKAAPFAALISDPGATADDLDGYGLGLPWDIWMRRLIDPADPMGIADAVLRAATHQIYAIADRVGTTPGPVQAALWAYIRGATD